MKRLFIDQYGGIWWGRTRRDLKEQIPGRVSIMYEDYKDGVYRVGYVIGRLWLKEYAPVCKRVNG